jgi:23S rRNA (uracil1939-C5)-methyltransferase
MATIVVGDDREKALRDAARRVLRDAARRVLRDAAPDAPTSLHVNLHSRDNALVFGPQTRHIAGPARLRENLAGASFLVSPTAFFQTNVRAAGVLVEQVLAAVPAGARVLDLYAGAGLFALPLALRGHQVVAVEENRAAVADGDASLRLSRVPAGRCRFVNRRVETAARVIAQLLPSPDVVLLDPPREGCTRHVLDGVVARSGAALVIYVSCSPESLARDLGHLTAAGYGIGVMQPVDMFPHTPHIETMVTLRRTAPESIRDRRGPRGR